MVLLHPLHLTFSSESAEHQYTEYRLKKLYKVVDNGVLGVLVSISIGYAAFVPAVRLLNSSSQLYLHWTSYMYKAVLLAQYTCLFILQRYPRSYVRWRNLSKTFFRLLSDIIAICGLPFWTPATPITDLKSSVRHVLLGAGIMFQNWQSFGVPVIFATHVQVHFAVNLLYLFTLNDGCCRFWLQTDEGRSYARSAWMVVNAVSTWTSQLGRIPCFRVAELPAFRLGDDMEECWAVLALLQLGLGYLLPTIVLYYLERKSRKHFLQNDLQVPCQENHSLLQRTCIVVLSSIGILFSLFYAWELMVVIRSASL